MNLNNSVGSTERCQGGFISPAIDDDSTGTDLEMSPELTSVDILDYTLTNHINFEVIVLPVFFLGTVKLYSYICHKLPDIFKYDRKVYCRAAMVWNRLFSTK